MSFPSGVASSTDSGNLAQTNKGYGFHVTLRYDVPPGSGTVTFLCSIPFPGPCTSLAAFTSDLAAVQLLQNWMSRLVGQGICLFLVFFFPWDQIADPLTLQPPRC